MAGNNGSSWKLDLRPPTEVKNFVIGGQTIPVTALTLYAMEMVKDELLSLGPDLDFITYARNVVRIVYKLTKLEHPEIDLEEQDLIKVCSISEMRQLATTMNELLELSGFSGGPTEQTPENPETGPTSGIGTSSELPQDSQPTGSATVTSTG